MVDAPEGNAEWRDALNFLLAPPRAYGYHNVALNVNNVTFTLVGLTGELYDSSGMHSTVSNSARINAVEAGLYTLKGHIQFEANGTGARGIMFRKNAAGSPSGGTELFLTYNLPSAGNLGLVFGSVDANLNATDYVEMYAYQSSGGALNLVNGATSTFLSARWVAKTST